MAERMNRIAVIGCGWLGLPLAQSLINIGYNISGTTTTKSKLETLEQKGIKAYLYNLYNEDIEQVSDDLFDVDQVVINIPPGRGNNNIKDKYAQGIKSLIDKISTWECQRIIYVSTTGVYDNTNTEVTEDDIAKPQKDSSAAVYEGELLVSSSGVNNVILRMAGLVGIDRQPGHWFAGRTNLDGGDTPVNMIHQDDCIAIISQIISTKEISGVFNVCADDHPSKQQFYTAQSEKIGVSPPIWKTGMLPHKIISNKKIKADMGYSFIHPKPTLF